MKLWLVLLLAALLPGCADRTARREEVILPDCRQLFVILPGNYIIDIAAGSEVSLNPFAQEFAVFCSADEAAGALRAALEDKRLSEREDWRVYILAENGPEWLKWCNGDKLCLAREAHVGDWLASSTEAAF